MTRTQKIQLIKKYRSNLYHRLEKHVPRLVSNPEFANGADIKVYNHFIGLEAMRDKNPNAFKKRFSF